MSLSLTKNSFHGKRKGPVVVIVMDGVGIGPAYAGNAVTAAKKPVLDQLMATCPNTTLRAHGTAVGMPSDADMGNSEVGHNALGAGRVFDQGAKLVANAIADGGLFAGPGWKEVVANAVAWPAAYFAMGRWLQNFAYRAPVGVWPFVLSAALTLVIALITVSYQAVRSAVSDPVRSLRYE